MNQIKSSGFWVTRCNSLVRCIILKSVRYKQLRGKKVSEEQPFMYCWVDFFGSFPGQGKLVACLYHAPAVHQK